MFLFPVADAVIRLFQRAGQVFLDMMQDVVPAMLVLLTTLIFLMKLIGPSRMAHAAALFSRSRLLTYGVLPVLAGFFIRSPGALVLGKLLPEKNKPGYADALGTLAHPLASVFSHGVPSGLVIGSGVAAGFSVPGLPVTALALRYLAAAVVIGLLRGVVTEYLFLRLSQGRDGA